MDFFREIFNIFSDSGSRAVALFISRLALAAILLVREIKSSK